MSTSGGVGDDVRIRRVAAGGHDDHDRQAVVQGLAEVLVDCVEGGASVGFMLPLTRERAEEFSIGALDDASPASGL